MVPPDSHGIPRGPQYLGANSRDTAGFAYRALTVFGEAFQTSSTTRVFGDSWVVPDTTTVGSHDPVSATLPGLTRIRFRLFPVRSPLLRESRLFSVPQGTEMFQFPWFASSVKRMLEVGSSGLPHSEISGSTLAYSYPKLIAVGHVLHRHLTPRHPPYALS